MKRLLIFILLITPIAKAQQVVPIQNPSFEAAVTFNGTDKCGQGKWGPIPNWQATQQPGGSFGVIDWTCVMVPDGKAVAFLGNASMSQDLGVLPQAGTYVLKFFVANWYYSYEGDYTVSLTIKGKPVCTISGYALGDFTEYTLVCTIDGHIAVDHHNFPAGNLGISVSNSIEWPILLDNFSLLFTQET